MISLYQTSKLATTAVSISMQASFSILRTKPVYDAIQLICNCVTDVIRKYPVNSLWWK